MPLQRLHFHGGQQVIDKGDVLVSELATIHLGYRVRDSCSSVGTRPPEEGSGLAEQATSARIEHK
jgi:hypothetical protein